MHATTESVILAAGLTPALQQIICLNEFRPGQVNRARQAHWCASGKVINVGLALHSLGAPSLTLAPLGGAEGEEIRSDVARRGVSARWVDCQTRTRVCTTIVDESAAVVTELVENAAPMEAGDIDNFCAVYGEVVTKASLVVLTGSLPQGVSPNFYRDLLQQTKVPAILDIRGTELLAALPAQPLLVKPNREELEFTLSRKLESDVALINGMRELNAHGAGWVLVTQGGDAVWLTSATNVFRFQPPRIKVVNSIGCGDSFAAGIAWALRQGHDMPQAVRYGVAAAAANAESVLPGQFDALSLNERIENVAVSEISLSGPLT